MDTPQNSIQIHCPQCAAQIEFLEEAQVIRCQYCGSSLLVAGREGVLRYVIPPRTDQPGAAQARAEEYLRGQGKDGIQSGETFLFYAPFWRMQATVYRWVFGLTPMKVEPVAGLPPPMERMKSLFTRLLDHTIRGTAGLELGLSSLGIRTQALRLQAFGPEHLEKRDSFLPLAVSLEEAQHEIERFSSFFFDAEKLQTEAVLHSLAGSTFSVIYFPIWYVACRHAGGPEPLLVDGLSQNILAGAPDRSSLLEQLRGEGSRKSFNFSDLRFLPFRCPNCGWTFPFYPMSVLHFCSSCRRLWREREGNWAEAPHLAALPPRPPAADGPLWVPFWRFRTVIESGGERLATMADLYRLAPPVRLIHPEQEAGRPIHFFLPASKFRSPQAYQTLASRLSFLQPEIALSPFPDGSHPRSCGISLSQEETRGMGAVILGALIPPNNRKARAWLKEGCRVELSDPQLLYFPFTRADLFYQEISTGLSFQRNVLCEPPLEHG